MTAGISSSFRWVETAYNDVKGWAARPIHRAWGAVEACLVPRIGPVLFEIAELCAMSEVVSRTYKVVREALGDLADGEETFVRRSCNVVAAASVMAAVASVLFGLRKQHLDNAMADIIADSHEGAADKKKAIVLETTKTPWETLLYPVLGWMEFRHLSHVANLRELAKEHSIKLIRVTSKKQLNNALENLPDGEVELLWIRGHGCPQAISLAEDCDLAIYDSFLMKRIARKVAKNAKIVLESCSTGVGDNNIACRLAKACRPATVYAPTVDINLRIGLNLDADGTAHFNDGHPFERTTDATRVFRHDNPSTDKPKRWWRWWA